MEMVGNRQRAKIMWAQPKTDRDVSVDSGGLLERRKGKEKKLRKGGFRDQREKKL